MTITNYQVLARKYRPNAFEDMVGQEYVLRILINALNHRRLHHAYLFSGSSGIGKTTVARLFAKCLSCMQGISATPCEQCTVCQSINHGYFLDLIEVDAASRTKVEDTRALLENLPYAPTQGRYKIYLIDEVHMLSMHSFNALLKTLEEPPAHVIFLLATTDPQRLPATVLSRCLQFHLKKLSLSQITTQLINILEKENIAYEPAALKPLAQAANGSLRDALSLLDQAIAYSDQMISEKDIRAMLGIVERAQVFELITSLLSHSGKNIMNITARLAECGVDFITILDELIFVLQQLALAQVVKDIRIDDEDEHEKIITLAQRIQPEILQLYYQIALIGRRDLCLAPTAQIGFEMVMLRMLAFNPVDVLDEIPVSVAEQSKLNSENKVNISSLSTELRWKNIIPQLNLSGVASALVDQCTLKELTENTVHLILDPAQSALYNIKQEKIIETALSTYFGKPISLQITSGSFNMMTPARLRQRQEEEQLNASMETLANDPKVQALVKAFDAVIQPDSVQTLELKTNL